MTIHSHTDNRLNLLTLWAVFLPLIAVHGSYGLSLWQGFVPVCMPYIDGCTSISATGRNGIAYVFFKVLMLPQAILLVVVWHTFTLGGESRAALVVRYAGIVGAAFLVLYVVFLGSTGDIYRLLRRYGVFIFFLGTWSAQIAATIHTYRQLRNQHPRPNWLTLQVIIILAMGLFAVAEVPLGTFGMADNQAENVIEWNFALLMQCWFAAWWFGIRSGEVTTIENTKRRVV